MIILLKVFVQMIVQCSHNNTPGCNELCANQTFDLDMACNTTG